MPTPLLRDPPSHVHTIMQQKFLKFAEKFSEHIYLSFLYDRPISIFMKLSPFKWNCVWSFLQKTKQIQMSSILDLILKSRAWKMPYFCLYVSFEKNILIWGSSRPLEILLFSFVKRLSNVDLITLSYFVVHLYYICITYIYLIILQPEIV